MARTVLHRLGTSENEWQQVLRWVVGRTRDALMDEFNYRETAFVGAIDDPAKLLHELDALRDRIERWRHVRRAVLTGDDLDAFEWARDAMSLPEPPVEPPARG